MTFSFLPSDQNEFNTNLLNTNQPFLFTYTLSSAELANTINAWPNGFFFVSIKLPNEQFVNLGNGTNNQTDYENQNVFYTPGQPLSFPNRSWGIVESYNFYLFFCTGQPNYYVWSFFTTPTQFYNPNITNGSDLLTFMDTTANYATIMNPVEINNDLISQTTYKVLFANNEDVKIVKM